jgi:hypothetical protein
VAVLLGSVTNASWAAALVMSKYGWLIAGL